MKHVEILRVLLKHGFYTDLRSPDLTIAPSDETARLLGNHRCLTRSSASGVRVLSPVDAVGQSLLPIPADTALVFLISARTGNFTRVTDLTSLSGQPTFTSVGAGPDGELQRVACDPALPLAPTVLAAVEVRLGAAAPPACFQLTFPAKRAQWAYYCATDAAPAAGALTVVDTSPDAPLLFSAATLDPADPIAAQITSGDPSLRCVYLTSDQPVAAREAPRKSLELRLGPDRVAGPLPNPSTQSAAKENLLFQIVEYRTHPFQNP